MAAAEGMASAFAGLVRRQWWVILLTMLTAAGVGFLFTSGAETTTTAKSTIAVDAALISDTGMPGAAQVLREVTAGDFRADASRLTGVPEGELASGMRAYMVGSPVNSLFVEYTSKDAETATRVAKQLGDLAVATALDLGSLEIEKQRTFIEEAKRAVAALESAEGVSPWENADIAFKNWQVKSQLKEAEGLFKAIRDTYVLKETLNTVVETGMRERLTTAVGAAIIGLVLGLGLAALRDRRQHPKAA